MIYLELIMTFMKIGAFSFGGGYAMIPLIQKEIEKHGWMTGAEFVDIIAIAEMTPGPIAVNAATFVGYKAAGVWGGIIATIGVAMPSLLLILLVSQFFFKYQQHPVNKMIFYGIRPVIVGLIATAAITIGQTSSVNFGSIAISILAFVAMFKFKLHPIITIIISGLLGIVVF